MVVDKYQFTTVLYDKVQGTVGNCKAMICELHSEAMKLIKRPAAAQGVGN